MKVLSQRQLRVNEQIRHLVSEIVGRDYSGRLITIGEVRVSPDLRSADVWVSTMAENDPAEQLCRELTQNRRHFEHIIRKALSTKHTPRLRFVADTGYDYAATIETKIRNLP